MKCEGCRAELGYAIDLQITLSHNHLVVQCPICKYLTAIIYNRKRQIWETEKQRDERRAGWRRGR